MNKVHLFNLSYYFITNLIFILFSTNCILGENILCQQKIILGASIITSIKLDLDSYGLLFFSFLFKPSLYYNIIPNTVP